MESGSEQDFSDYSLSSLLPLKEDIKLEMTPSSIWEWSSLGEVSQEREIDRGQTRGRGLVNLV